MHFYKQNIDFFRKLTIKGIQNFGRNTKKHDFLVSLEKVLDKQIEQEEKPQQRNQFKSKYDFDEENQEFKELDLSSINNNKQQNEIVEHDEENTHFDKEKIRFIRNSLLYKGDDPYYNKLVTRPQKGVVWGLGGQLMLKKKHYFTKGTWPNLEEVIAFLELEQAKDIITIDSEIELKRFDLPKNIVILSSFSNKHNYKIAKSLSNALKQLNIKNSENIIKIYGRRDDEWLLMDFNNIAIHMFTEESREEMDLEWKLKNPTSQEEIDEFLKIALLKKKRAIFEPLQD